MVDASLSCSLLVEGQNVSCAVIEEEEGRETLILGSFLPSSSEEDRQTIGRLSSEESDIGEPSLVALLPALVLSKPFHANSCFSSWGSTLSSTLGSWGSTLVSTLGSTLRANYTIYDCTGNSWMFKTLALKRILKSIFTCR